MNSYRTVTKIAFPKTSKELDYVVSVYRSGEFKFAYRYKDWSDEAVAKEIVLLRNRFSDSEGFSIIW